MATFPSCRDLSQFGESVVIACTKEGRLRRHRRRHRDKEEEAVIIEMQEPVTLTFACRYIGPSTVRTCR
jgi:proliferating cell nuclear antigen